MGLIDKLEGIKTTIIENFEEYEIIKDMSAKEIAERYGYEKLLSHIRFNLLMAKEQNGETKIETEDEEKKNTQPSILIKINRDENGYFTVWEEGFGEKEKFDLNVVKFMLKKYEMNTSIGTIEGSNDEYLKVEIIPQRPTMERRLEDLYDNKDEYIGIAKEKARQATKAAGNATKKLLNNLADWANNNL